MLIYVWENQSYNQQNSIIFVTFLLALKWILLILSILGGNCYVGVTQLYCMVFLGISLRCFLISSFLGLCEGKIHTSKLYLLHLSVICIINFLLLQNFERFNCFIEKYHHLQTELRLSC